MTRPRRSRGPPRPRRVPAPWSRSSTSTSSHPPLARSRPAASRRRASSPARRSRPRPPSRPRPKLRPRLRPPPRPPLRPPPRPPPRPPRSRPPVRASSAVARPPGNPAVRRCGRSTGESCRRSPRAAYYAPHSVLGAHIHEGVRHGADAAAVRRVRVDRAARRDRGCPWSTSGTASGSAVLPAPEVPDYRLAVDVRGRRRDRRRRPLPVPADARRARPAPHRRGPARAAVDGARRARPALPDAGFDGTVITGTRFAVWAPNARAVRVVGDFNGWDGRGARRCAASAAPASGSCSSPASAGRALQVRDPRPATAHWRQKADPMARAPRSRRRRRRVVTESHVRLERRRLDAAPGDDATRTPAR